MTSSQPQNSSAETRSKGHLIFPGLFIIAFFTAGYFGVNWWHARTEMIRLSRELKITRTALQDAQMKVDAYQLIMRQQLEMLRKAQQDKEIPKP